MSRKGGQGEVSGFIRIMRVKPAWLCLGLAVEKPLLANGWAISLWSCIIGHVGPPFSLLSLDGQFLDES